MHGSMTSVKKGLVARASRASPLFSPWVAAVVGEVWFYVHGAQNIRMCKLLHSCHWYIYICVVFLEVVSLCHPEGRHGGREGEGRGVVYSYVTEDEEEMNEPAAEPAPPRTEATALRTDSTAPRARSGPPGCAAKSAATPGRRAGRSQDSSSDRERGRRRPPSPASPVRVDRSPIALHLQDPRGLCRRLGWMSPCQTRRAGGHQLEKVGVFVAKERAPAAMAGAINRARIAGMTSP